MTPTNTDQKFRNRKWSRDWSLLHDHESELADKLLRDIFGPEQDPQISCPPKDVAEKGFTVPCHMSCFHCSECGMPDYSFHEEGCPNTPEV